MLLCSRTRASVSRPDTAYLAGLDTDAFTDSISTQLLHHPVCFPPLATLSLIQSCLDQFSLTERPHHRTNMEIRQPTPSRASNTMSPIFDFDRAWVDSIKSIRDASKQTLAQSQPALSTAVLPPPLPSKLPLSSTMGVQPTYLLSTWPPLPTQECIPVYDDPWASSVSGNQRQYYSPICRCTVRWSDLVPQCAHT